MDRPERRGDVWVAIAGTPPLCDTCSRRGWGLPVMCTHDPLRILARTCREYERAPGSDDDR